MTEQELVIAATPGLSHIVCNSWMRATFGTSPGDCTMTSEVE